MHDRVSHTLVGPTGALIETRTSPGSDILVGAEHHLTVDWGYLAEFRLAL